MESIPNGKSVDCGDTEQEDESEETTEGEFESEYELR